MLIALVLFLLPAFQVSAATFTANNSATLVSAIASANANSEADTINITGNITLSTYPETITANITINGNGYTINGADTYYAFTVYVGAHLTLNRLIISNFARSGGNGAGLQVVGTATLNQVVVRNSTTSSSGKHGGGIWVANGATLNMSRSAVHGNTATQNGGGIGVAGGGTVTITNSTIYGNTAASGGGIFIGEGSVSNTPTVTLRHVTITGNKRTGSTNRGGLRLNFGTVHLQNSIIYGNQGINCDSVNNSDGNFVTLSGNIIGGTGNASKCTLNQLTSDPLLSSSPTGSPPYYTIPANSPARNAATCISGVTEDQRGFSRPQPAGNTNCDIGAYEYHPPTQNNSPVRASSGSSGASSGSSGASSGSSGGSSGASSDSSGSRGVAVFKYSPAQTCQTLQPDIVVNNAGPGTACQRVNHPAGLGHPELVAAMPYATVDIWGWVSPNTQVCFRAASGSIKFVDTAALPRTIADLPPFYHPGLICAPIDAPGQVALVAGPPAPVPTAIPPVYQSLQYCMVRTQYILNLRASPGGEIIDILPFNIKLTALERTDGWLKVDFMGAKGWISADFVEQIGTCG